MELEEAWLKWLWCLIQIPKYLFKSWKKSIEIKQHIFVARAKFVTLLYLCVSFCLSQRVILLRVKAIITFVGLDIYRQQSMLWGVSSPRWRDTGNTSLKVTQHTGNRVSTRQCCWQGTEPASQGPENITIICVVSLGQPIREHNLTFRLQSGGPQPSPSPAPPAQTWNTHYRHYRHYTHYRHYITQYRKHKCV